MKVAVIASVFNMMSELWAEKERDFGGEGGSRTPVLELTIFTQYILSIFHMKHSCETLKTAFPEPLIK